MNKSFKNTIEEIDQSISTMLRKKNELEDSISKLKEARELLFQANNVCRNCYGSGYTYDYSLIQGDPYAKSSDAEVICKTCGGTKEYVK